MGAVSLIDVLGTYLVPPGSSGFEIRYPKPANGPFTSQELRVAFKRLQINEHRYRRSYFESILDAWDMGAPVILEHLASQLQSNGYELETPIRVYDPKPSKLLRPMAIISITDQIVFTAAADRIGRVLPIKHQQRWNSSVFSNFYTDQHETRGLYRNWTQGYETFLKAGKKLHNLGYRYHATFDLAACYDSISHPTLFARLRDIGLDSWTTELLKEMLDKWSGAFALHQEGTSTGIPQGPHGSHMLAEVMLAGLDEAMEHCNIIPVRYVDDVVLFAKKELDVQRGLIALDQRCRELGLTPQSAKIQLSKADTGYPNMLASIANIPDFDYKAQQNQPQIKILLAQVKHLTPEHRVNKITSSRLRWLLGTAQPSAEVANRLVRMLENHPELHYSVTQYLRKFSKLPNSVADNIIKRLDTLSVYPGTLAGCLEAVARCATIYKCKKLCSLANAILRSGQQSRDVRLVAWSMAILIRSKAMTNQRLTRFLNNRDVAWWARVATLQFCERQRGGLRPGLVYPSNALLWKLVGDRSSEDVSIVAAAILLGRKSTTRPPKTHIRPLTRSLFQEFQFPGVQEIVDDPVQERYHSVFGKVTANLDMHVVFGEHYPDAQSTTFGWPRLRFRNRDSFVNKLDHLNEMLVRSLCQHNPSLGKCKVDGLGSFLSGSDTSRLNRLAPSLWKALKLAHQLRNENATTHSRSRRTGTRNQHVSAQQIADVVTAMTAGLHCLTTRQNRLDIR
jgi:hypothetical protein